LKAKKLNLEFENEKVGKRILVDILREGIMRNGFLFRRNPKGYDKWNEHSDAYAADSSEITGMWDSGHSDSNNHRDHTDYSEKYSEQFKPRYGDYKELPTRHRDSNR